MTQGIIREEVAPPKTQIYWTIFQFWCVPYGAIETCHKRLRNSICHWVNVDCEGTQKTQYTAHRKGTSRFKCLLLSMCTYHSCAKSLLRYRSRVVYSWIGLCHMQLYLTVVYVSTTYYSPPPPERSLLQLPLVVPCANAFCSEKGMELSKPCTSKWSEYISYSKYPQLQCIHPKYCEHTKYIYIL